MERQVFSPIALAYRGLDADVHTLDAVQAGKSVAGTAKLYNSVIHFYFHGTIPAKNYQPSIRTYVGAPKGGSLTYIFVSAVLYDQLMAYPAILCELADVIVPKFLSAIFAKRTKRTADMDKALDIIQEQSRQHHELAQTALKGFLMDRQQLHAVIDRLTSGNRTAMAEMAAPVGTTCRTISHFDHTKTPEVVDEPMADVMRSKEDLEVGAQTELLGILVGVDTITGACRVELPESGIVARGKITDPALRTPHNVYTMALDNRDAVVLTAKPIMKDGELAKLFISDARVK
jgi:hypothetical protein